MKCGLHWNNPICALETHIRKYTHPECDSSNESYPTGLCQRALYKCKKSDEKGEALEHNLKEISDWIEFQLQLIKVPRTSGDSSLCPCPMCRCAHYNPIGVVGPKEIVNLPVVNPQSGQMECESQSPVMGRGRGTCRGLRVVCGQVTGRGVCHPCK